jgi:taurine dioxygenase
MDNRQPHESSARVPPVAATIVPLSPAIGAEVIGVDLRHDLDDATFARIRDAWFEHCILLFRGQQIEDEDQVRFAGRFGELSKVLHQHDGHTRHPSVMLISNIRKDGKLIGALPDGEMYFHSDQCYMPRPSAATALYAIEVPRRGGNTLFANMYAAYDTLPEDVKRRLEGLKALNVYDYAANPTKRGPVRPDAPQFAHPVVRVHPGTGRKALYVNRLMTDHIVGLPRDESDRLLAFLFDHQEQPRFVYEHVWTPGDLILWDNRSALHARSDFEATERRLLRRVAILGEATA